MTSAAETPKYRHCINQDIVGGLGAAKRDCTEQMRNEIKNGDEFVFMAQDCQAWEEYCDYLTPAEMLDCFKKALKG